MPNNGDELQKEQNDKAKIGGDDAPAIERRKIYQNSRDSRLLETAGAIEPGAKYIVKHQDGSAGECSFGWTVGQGDRVFNLTAGHCGSKGDIVYVHPRGYEPISVGEIVWREFDERNVKSQAAIGIGPDYALIEFYSEATPYVHSTPGVYLNRAQVELAGWQDAYWLQKNRPYMCLFGWRTGIACGEFVEMTSKFTVRFEGQLDSGDSGGTVWAFDPADPTGHKIYAVAITSFEQDNDATLAGGKVIGPVMSGLDLKLYN